VVLWVSGCKLHCSGCQNSQTWAFNSGIRFGEQDKEELFDALDKSYIKGLTLSGGNPLDSYDEILPLVKEVKEKFPDKDIWLYSGYYLDQIQRQFKEILDYVDVIVDGPYDENFRDIELHWRGSSNQKVYRKKNNNWIVEEDNYGCKVCKIERFCGCTD
jgi:anaerobic ribonucleoside-triphosphate reductase activating protein